MNPLFSFRPVRDSDSNFLYQLYASTRLDIQQMIGWTDQQKEQFLQFQFEAQQTHYHAHFPMADFSVVVNSKQKPIGRLYQETRTDEIRIIDISLLPEHRRKGIGSAMIKGVMEKGRLARLPVKLHVAKYNPALNWYTGIGFSTIEETDMSFLMEWSAFDSTTPAVLIT